MPAPVFSQMRPPVARRGGYHPRMVWILFIHSVLRWVLLAAILGALGLALKGWLGKHPFSKPQRITHIVMIASLHLQVALGALLYVQSWAYVLLEDPGGTMKNAMARFWAVEHVFAMVVGAVLIQVGHLRAKKAKDDAAKHQRTLIWVGIGLLIVLAGMPWPFRPEIGRPWLPSLPG